MSTNTKSRTKAVRVPIDLYERLEDLAASEKRSITKQVAVVIEAGLQGKEAKQESRAA